MKRLSVSGEAAGRTKHCYGVEYPPYLRRLPLWRRPSLLQVQGVAGVENVGVARLVCGHADYMDHMGDVLDAVALTGV